MKSETKTIHHRIMASLLILILMLTSAVLPVNVKAAGESTKELTLKETKVSLKSGETVKLKVKSRPYKKSEVYSSYWFSSDSSIASVDENGKVTALIPGTAVITLEEYIVTDAGYYAMTAECKITVKKGEVTLKKHELTMLEEESATLSLPDGVSVSYEINYDTYPMAYVDVYEGQEEEGQDGKLVLNAWGDGTAFLDVSFYNAKGKLISMDRCKITVLRKGIDATEITRAVGKTYTFGVNGYEQSDIISWESENPEIATVNKSGKMTAVSEGSTYITLTVMGEEEEERKFTCEVSVSDPRLAKKEQNLALNYSDEIVIDGLAYSSEIEVTSSKPEVVEVQNTYIYARAKGTAVITINVDGIKLKYKVRVTNPTVSNTLIAVVKGKSAQIKVTGTNSYSEVKYETSNKKIATVNKTGKVKSLKNGTATITVTVDGKSMYVPVSISNTKVVSALNYAISAIGSAYSQANRMSSGYYDCSSLAWRSYHTAGINFGNSSWATTAAGIAEYLVKNKKAIAYEALPAEKLQPGDLLFFAKGDNGRYKNIYHVAIYAGTITESSDWWGETETYNTGLLLEARNEGVGLFNYYEYARDVVVVARPTK